MRHEASTHLIPGDAGRFRSDYLRIYVISDVRIYREALKSSLEITDGILVVGTGSFTEATFLELASAEAQLVLVECVLPASIADARTKGGLGGGPKFIALGVGDSDEQILACIEAGFSGYVSANGSIEDLQRVICETMENKFNCSPRLTAILARKLAQLSKGSAAASLTSCLTPRQKEIARLLGQGLTNKEIGRKLSIRSTTVRNHLHAIFERLNVRRRAEAVAMLHVQPSRATDLPKLRQARSADTHIGGERVV
ncbi:MAG: response regulator transcription factor [Bradyrhizobiaceae bacterium]|nr:response regulator transcription factor [Bradyrhizobiaceae bacterium]